MSDVPCAAAPTPRCATASRASRCWPVAAARSSICGRSPARIRSARCSRPSTRPARASLPELRDYFGFCYQDVPSNPLVQIYESWLDALERVRKPGRLLDVGCGTGLFLAVARRRGWQPFGIDDCAEATRHARDHFGLDVWDGEFADFASGDRRFDAITGWDIIEHSRSRSGCSQAIRRCLAPGGVVGLSTPNQRSILDVVAGALYRLSGGRIRAPLEKFYIDQHFLYFTPETLAQALGRAGARRGGEPARAHGPAPAGALARDAAAAARRCSEWRA